MQRITPVSAAETTGPARELLNRVQAKLGMTPNMMKTMAAAPAVLEAYLDFGAALSKGALAAKFREQIALAVAQANSCEYCLAAHTAAGRMAGLQPEEIALNRAAASSDPKREAGLEFAQAIVVQRGRVSDEAVRKVRDAGYTDQEIIELVGNVAVNIFTNYFNLVVRTDLDFPPVTVALQQAEPQPSESAPAPVRPPFTRETATEKVRLAEAAWNTRDPDRVSLAYTEDSEWRNRAEFIRGRDQIRAFLRRKWDKELDYRLKKTLWTFDAYRIAVTFEYEFHDDSGQWYRSYGNELWEFNDDGLMRRRIASINDAPIAESERRLRG